MILQVEWREKERIPTVGYRCYDCVYVVAQGPRDSKAEAWIYDDGSGEGNCPLSLCVRYSRDPTQAYYWNIGDTWEQVVVVLTIWLKIIEET